MGEDFLDRVVDYFDPWELVAILGLSIEDVVNAFRDEIEDKAMDLQEFMEHGA